MKERNYFIKKGAALYPAYESDKEYFDSIPDLAILAGNLVRPRNPEFLAKFWVLCQHVIDNLPENYAFQTPTGDLLPIKTKADVSFHIKMQLGLWSLKMSLGGRPIYEVGSISFQSMKEPDFEKFFSNAIDAVLKYFLVAKGETEAQRAKRKEQLQLEVIEKFTKNYK